MKRSKEGLEVKLRKIERACDLIDREEWATKCDRTASAGAPFVFDDELVMNCDWKRYDGASTVGKVVDECAK